MFPEEGQLDMPKLLMQLRPAIQRMRGKKIVIKLGGSLLREREAISHILEETALLQALGLQFVVVHGGGPEISLAMEREGLKPRFINGLRVTDKRAIEVVKRVMFDEINRDLAERSRQFGAKVRRLSGFSDRIVHVEKLLLENGDDLGFVGKVASIDTGALVESFREEAIALIATMGVADNGVCYNVNGDITAGEIATALSADELIFLTDKPGLLADIGDEGSTLPFLSVEELRSLIESEVIKGGMLPKVNASIKALRGGVKRVFIADGRVEQLLLKLIILSEWEQGELSSCGSLLAA